MSKDKNVHGYIAQRLEQERANQSQSLAQRILSSVNKSYLGEQTVAWLKNIDENINPSATDGAQSQPPQAIMSSVNVMDKLFDDFERYSFHYNQTEPDRGFVTTCRRPVFSGEGADRHYIGFLLNSFWTAVVVSGPHVIQGMLMPARFAYEEPARRPSPEPFFEVTGTSHVGNVTWKADGRPLHYSDIAALSKLIFARLTRVSRGEVGEGEKLFNGEVESHNQPYFQFSQAAEPAEDLDMIGNALITLIESIDGDLAELDRKGMQVLKTEGVKGVARVVSRVEALRSFREKAAALATEWASSLSSQV
jgi:hypothetical protein